MVVGSHSHLVDSFEKKVTTIKNSNTSTINNMSIVCGVMELRVAENHGDEHLKHKMGNQSSDEQLHVTFYTNKK